MKTIKDMGFDSTLSRGHNEHASFLKVTQDIPCPLNIRDLCEECWRGWGLHQAKCLSAFHRIIASLNGLGWNRSSSSIPPGPWAMTFH